MACGDSMFGWKETEIQLGSHYSGSHLGPDPVPGHTAAPDHAAVAEVQRLGPGEHAAQAQPALVPVIGVPAVVRNN